MRISALIEVTILFLQLATVVNFPVVFLTVDPLA